MPKQPLSILARVPSRALARVSLVALLAIPHVASAATALVRWRPVNAAAIAGYRVYVRHGGAPYASAAWAGNPAAAADGTMSATVAYTPSSSGTDYFTVVATSTNAESGLSGELPIGPTHPCRDDRCVTKTACTFGPRPDGTSCDDSSFCNGPEVCVAGACDVSQTRDCADAIGCTVDACDEAAAQCTHDGPAGCCIACETLDPCLAEACSIGDCTAGPGADIEVNRVKLMGKGESIKLIAKLRFTMDPAVDPSVTGATIQMRSADGALVYTSTIPGRLIKTGASRGRFRYTASQSTSAPLGLGLTRLDFRIKGSLWLVTVMANTPQLADAALESTLTVSMHLGGSCARRMDVPCSQKPGLSLCR